MANPPSSARERYGDLAPGLAGLHDDVLFGQVWERPELPKRDRSLVTISSLISLNRTEQLGAHIRIGLGNGLTREEIIETITHLAFYSGWPTAMSALAIARKAFDEEAP